MNRKIINLDRKVTSISDLLSLRRKDSKNAFKLMLLVTLFVKLLSSEKDFIEILQ